MVNNRWFIIGLLVMLVLVGCEEEASDPTPENTPEPTATTVPSELLIWFEDAALEQSLSSINSSFSTITPILTRQESETFLSTLAEAIDGGEGPDVIIGSLSLLEPLAASRYVVPLDQPELQSLEPFLIPTAFAVGVQDGDLFAFPLQINPSVFYYSAVNDNLSLEAAERIVAHPDFVTTAGWLTPRDGRLLLEDGLNLTQAELGAYFQAVLALNADWSANAVSFLSGEADGYLGRLSELPILRAELGDDLRIGMIPEGATLLAEATVAMVSINAPRQDYNTAHTWLNFVLQPEQEFAQSAGLPPMGAVGVEDELLSQGQAFIRNAEVIPVSFYPQLDQLNDLLAQVIAQTITPEDAAAAFFE